jgi:hypothetical protein
MLTELIWPSSEMLTGAIAYHTGLVFELDARRDIPSFGRRHTPLPAL